MSDLPGITIVPGAALRSRMRRLGADFLLLPVWVQALAVYIASRIISIGIFAAVLRRQEPSTWSSNPVETSLNDFLNFWDSEWYARVARDGYPQQLPVDAAGNVLSNEWAFYPLHPAVVSDLAQLTGLSFQVIAPLVSTVAAGVAAIVILVLFRRFLGPGQALTSLAYVVVFPSAAVFSTGYAESLTLLLQALALLLVIDRRYLMALPVVVLMDLSRPIGVAFSFFMLFHLIDRFRRRRVEAYPAAEVVRSWILGVFSCAAALIHPVHAWLVTGSPTAYTDTEAAWHTGGASYLVQWIGQANSLVGGFGPVLLIAVVAGMLALVFGSAGARMGRSLQLFSLAYGVYLLIFFTPQTSTLRMMLPLFPLAMVLGQVRNTALRITVLIVSVIFQVIWVGYLWHFTPPADLPP